MLLFVAMGGAVWAATTPEGWHFSRAFLGNKAGYFALGMVSAGTIGQTNGNGARPSYSVVAARWVGGWRFASTLAIAMTLGWWQGGAGKLLPPLVWAVCLAAESQSWLLSTALRSRLAQWLGGLSYSLYLANEPIQKLLGIVLGQWADGDGRWFAALWIPGALGLPILVAMALRRWIEVPALAWARRGGYTRLHENSR